VIFIRDLMKVMRGPTFLHRMAQPWWQSQTALCVMRNGRDVYYYGHLRDEKDGTMNVSAGEQIGRVGTSGNAQGRPPHVHFELRRDGEKIDPYPDLYASAHEVDLKLTDATANSPSAANSLPVAAIIALILGSKWLS
jgi:Peptidase family M23